MLQNSAQRCVHAEITHLHLFFCDPQAKAQRACNSCGHKPAKYTTPSFYRSWYAQHMPIGLLIRRRETDIATQPACEGKHTHHVAGEEAVGVAVCSQPSRPPDPVDVGLQAPWEVVVHDVRQRPDVKPTGGHVSGNQHLPASNNNGNPFASRVQSVNRRAHQRLSLHTGGASHSE